nr:LacI family DNA-binding transcriptional regulator [Micromonospora sp. DSM 115978]
MLPNRTTLNSGITGFDRARQGGPALTDERDKRPTIYDVAREAGVATSTVSRALSNPGRVSARTRDHVFE